VNLKSSAMFSQKGVSILLWMLCSVSLWADVLKTPPERPDVDSKYLFYLHGRIVEGSNGSPESKSYGTYQYPEIVNHLSQAGFTVISEVRPQGTKVTEYARKVSNWVSHLKAKGVPPSNITVVGGSKGGVIACHVDPKVNYVILAGLFKGMNKDGSIRLSGRVLSIHDSADKLGIDPEPFLKPHKLLTESKTVVTELGVGHGLIYQARDVWVEPLLKWTFMTKSD